MKEDPIQSDSDETVDDDTLENEELRADSGDVTRLASSAELRDLARLRAAAPRRRSFVFGLVIVLQLGVLAALVAVLIGRNEKSISWPGALTGKYDDSRRLLFVDDETALLVYWPNDARNIVSGDGTNCIDVVTAVGRDRTVPFHLQVACQTLTNGLRTTTRQSYEAWKRARTQDKWHFNVADERIVFLNDSENGYPAWSIDYIRENAGSILSGRALYIRHLGREVVVLRELPMSARGRAENLLDDYTCIVANLAAVRARFEIPEVREPGPVKDLLFDAYGALQNGFLAADWQKLDRAIRTAILTARESGDRRLQQDAQALYSTFRTKLQNWYVRQCLEFQLLNAPPHDGEMSGGTEKRMAERTAIRRECARRLPKESDRRQRRVANDDWSLP